MNYPTPSPLISTEILNFHILEQSRGVQNVPPLPLYAKCGDPIEGKVVCAKCGRDFSSWLRK